ncbi:NrfD/PsrC family molybdoenzyme membrane anchor subunit [Eggerthella timonensis]|uniref:NrfD/PsrC family molybdoenzyme membrane anchor subunit n=1 Tax=Eggerthella timonensis TaxID=1871008 RepID=UPI000C792202|nr:NrfD/PsrC family molybdoenzyme membrane anchor subunit [Eggerthella timonensis]
MVWGPMIAWYLFLAGASAGAFLTSAFVEAKYPDSVKMRVAGRIIAPVFLGIGLVMLMLDAEAGLHNPLRFFWLIANPGSVMTLGVYFICVFMPVSLVSALLEILKKRVPKWLTWIGIVFAFAVAAYTGFLLGVVKAFPLWNNAILPILFVVSALSAGLAATSLVGLIVDRERFEQMWLIKKSHVILSAIEIVVLATMLIIVSAGSVEGAASVQALLVGQYAPAFWGGLVLLGLVAPFIIEGYPVFITKRVETSMTSMVVSVIGEAGVLVGGFVLRLLVILAALPVMYL